MDFYIIWAWLAIGLAGLWVWIGEWTLAKSSLEAMGKNPEMWGTFLVLTILGIALVESAAIYALIISFQVIGLDPASEILAWKVIGAWLAIGFAWLGAGVWEGKLVSGAMDAILRNPEMKGKIMTYMVLFLALVEAVAIYGLIIALNLIGG